MGVLMGVLGVGRVGGGWVASGRQRLAHIGLHQIVLPSWGMYLVARVVGQLVGVLARWVVEALVGPSLLELLVGLFVQLSLVEGLGLCSPPFGPWVPHRAAQIPGLPDPDCRRWMVQLRFPDPHCYWWMPLGHWTKLRPNSAPPAVALGDEYVPLLLEGQRTFDPPSFHCCQWRALQLVPGSPLPPRANQPPQRGRHHHG